MRGRVGPVDAARQHGHGRAPRGERAPVCGLVDAEGGAGHHRHALAREVAPRARRRPRRRTSSRSGEPTTATDRSAQLVEAASGRAATGRAERRPCRSAARTGRGHRSGAGHSSSPGHEEPDASPVGPLEVARRVEPPQPGGHVGGHARGVALVAEVGVDLARPRGRPPGRASRGSPGSPSRLSATRASRSPAGAALTGDVTAHAASDGQQQRLAGAQPHRDVELARAPAGRRRAGRPPSRPAGAPAWRRDRSAAGVHAFLERARGAASVSGQRSSSLGPGTSALSRQSRAGVALGLPSGGRRSRGPGSDARSARAGPAGRGPRAGHRLDVPRDVDPVDDRAAELAGGTPGGGPRCRCSGCRGWSGGSRRRGTGCRRSPPSCGPGRSPTPRRGRSSPRRSPAAGAAPR